MVYSGKTSPESDPGDGVCHRRPRYSCGVVSSIHHPLKGPSTTHVLLEMSYYMVFIVCYKYYIFVTEASCSGELQSNTVLIVSHFSQRTNGLKDKGGKKYL